MSYGFQSATSGLTVMRCTTCFVDFAIPEEMRERRQERGGDWYCPAGHRNYYGESELQRKEKELVAAKAALEKTQKETERVRGYLHDEQNSHRTTVKRLNAHKGVVTRMKRRITKGRCVCCSKEFKDLGKHMKESHPKWNPDKHAEAIEAK